MEDRHLASPHLQMILKRFASELKNGDAEDLYADFLKSVAEAGASEVGYERISGQSFNPRSARLALVLLQEADVRDASVIREAFVKASLGESYRGYLDEGASSVLAGAFLLDRLRHLHLELQPEWDLVLTRSLQLSAQLTNSAPRISLLLEKGVERIERQRRAVTKLESTKPETSAAA